MGFTPLCPLLIFLIFNTHKITEVPNCSYPTGAIALDISKAFEKLCYTNTSLEESTQLSSSFSQLSPYVGEYTLGYISSMDV